MASTQIDDPPASKKAPGSTGDFPGFVQLLARQASGFTDGPAQPIKERLAGKPAKVILGEPAPRRRRESDRRQCQLAVTIFTIPTITITAPASRATMMPVRPTFSIRTRPVSMATHTRFITPAAKRTHMRAQQHPRQ